MSGNTSATGGFLQPTSGPLEDPALTDALTATVVGITGIPATMVRPRWQPTPPNQPPPSTNWCAMGITEREPMNYPYLYHDGTGNGQDVMSDWESFTVLVSFYGPAAFANAGILRRGLMVSQNRDALAAQSIKVTDVGTQTAVPDLTNMQWIDHVDVPVTLVRENVAAFPVLNILGAQWEVEVDA